MHKAIIRTVCLVILVGIIFGAVTWWNTSNVLCKTSYSGLHVHEESLSDNEFSMRVDTGASALGFFKYEYEIDENCLYITIYTSIFRGKAWPPEIKIVDSALSDVDSVYLKDELSIKQIYPDK